MKIQLPFVLRKTHERVSNELVKDIRAKEAVKREDDKKIENLKSDVQEIKNSSYSVVMEKDREIRDLKLELDKMHKEAKGMKWCIQQRDKELKDVRAFNMKLYKKVELSSEMYRQFKDTVDRALAIDFVTGAITPADVKKFMKVEDIVKLYTLIGIAGK